MMIILKLGLKTSNVRGCSWFKCKAVVHLQAIMNMVMKINLFPYPNWMTRFYLRSMAKHGLQCTGFYITHIRLTASRGKILYRNSLVSFRKYVKYSYKLIYPSSECKTVTAPICTTRNFSTDFCKEVLIRILQKILLPTLDADTRLHTNRVGGRTDFCKERLITRGGVEHKYQAY
jgi:hypothetical protein